MDITRRMQQVTSFEIIEKALMHLAERPTPERISKIDYVAEVAKHFCLEQLTGISYNEYKNWSYLRRVLTRQGRECLDVITQIDKMKIAAVKFAYWKLSNLAREGTRV